MADQGEGRAGERIKALRTQRAWSARRLADECERAGARSLTRSAIAKIEADLRRLRTDEAVALARALGVPLADLLGAGQEDTRARGPARLSSDAAGTGAGTTAETGLRPCYIPRDEEREIMAAVEWVRAGRQSQAVLLYGPGGVGKTRLVRALADGQGRADLATWLEPIDMDDPEHWLLANLQGAIARQLGAGNDHFGQYLRYPARPAAQDAGRVSAEALLSYLGQVRRLFLDCYAAYIEATGKPVVIVLDTVEAIRGMELLGAVTHWMKTLPGTLFVLSGRPVPDPAPDGARDPIEGELIAAHQPMPVTTVRLAEFTTDAAERYLAQSPAAGGLSGEERARLILLTRGHPLWLALAVAYLDDKGIPDEARAPRAGDAMPAADGQELREQFRRRLVSPYRDADFWHEAVRRLAAVRQGVNEPVWRELMADRPLPAGVASATEAWHQFLATPWVRRRASQRFVTLNDAMAEELARSVIPALDQARQWRRDLWQRAAGICDARSRDQEQWLRAQSQKLDSRRQLARESGPTPDSGEPALQQEPFISEASRLRAGKREVDQLKVSGLEYQLLCDFTAGCRRFLDLFAQAKRDEDLLLADLLATAMRRYLPASDAPVIVDDVAGGVVLEFRDWLTSGQHELHREIGTTIAEYLVGMGRGPAAVETLKSLPMGDADDWERIRYDRLLGHAYLSVRGQVKTGLGYLEDALSVARGCAAGQPERHRLVAQAYRQLGVYYSSLGRWRDADEAYERAQTAIAVTLAQRTSDEDRSEMASIQSSWAYVKGLGGYYRDGLSLVESAIAVHERLGQRLAAGVSHSTRGEVYRYQQQFRKAWKSYARAEAIFAELDDLSWLGSIYQMQAICLFQAYCDGTSLTDRPDQLAQARELALEAVEICREHAARSYPSALNRAGRIVGHQDPDQGLRFLEESIDEAREMSDGWFWLASLVEHAELSYRAWTGTPDDRYRAGIAAHEPDLGDALAEYAFADLRGRWEVIRGHLFIHDWVATGHDAYLDHALREYTGGFQHIAESGHIGSSGTSVIPGAFSVFRGLLRKLPDEVQARWLEHFRLAWTSAPSGSTILLARLEQLY